MTTCDSCKGSKVDIGSNAVICSVCKGKGTVTRSESIIVFTVACNHCRGTGYSSAYPCRTCSGQGYSHSTHSTKIDIPPGTEDGQSMAFTNNVTEVLITIRVKKSDTYQKIGDHIYSDLNVDVYTALLGGTITGQTVYGPINVKVSVLNI
ncbi:Chaperone protein DnaJ [Thelohanellus kitauei]|uniref:Chaperone protein DnaJ n=1 Tax=Thelohanellus kitauei TaxID=669202 RepID=A0A0C2J3N5_THEKT|nr:Chaperone protein DnaJ [Thelohanellus kitauei]